MGIDTAGMEVNAARPNDKLPYKGAWLWVGEEMIHLMELPNPDPADGRPEHGGRDRHLCLVCPFHTSSPSLAASGGPCPTLKFTHTDITDAMDVSSSA